MRTIFALIALALMGTFANAADMSAREGWVVTKTAKSFDQLIASVEAAVADNKMGLVTQASASAGAASRGVTILGNRIMGVYRNDFAVRMLEASVAAGIEAPIRFYVTENEDKTATLSYRTPTTVFAPYMAEGGEGLAALVADLEPVFNAIHDQAVK